MKISSVITAGNVGQSDGEHGLVFAINSRTMSEVSGLVLLDHLRDSAIRQDVAGVDQPVKHLCGLLNLDK